MSIRVTTDVFCDLCGNWQEGTTDKEVQAAYARQVAAKRGWRTVRRDRKLIDICPTCRKKEEGCQTTRSAKP